VVFAIRDAPHFLVAAPLVTREGYENRSDAKARNVKTKSPGDDGELGFYALQFARGTNIVGMRLIAEMRVRCVSSRHSVCVSSSAEILGRTQNSEPA